MHAIHNDREQENQPSYWPSVCFEDEDTPHYSYPGYVYVKNALWGALRNNSIFRTMRLDAAQELVAANDECVFYDELDVTDFSGTTVLVLGPSGCPHPYFYGARKATPTIDWDSVPVIGQDLLYAVEAVESPLEKEFQEHLRKWSEETAYISSATQIVLHPSYQRIIGMGPAVLPIIFKNMQETEQHDWFWALVAITGDNPVESKDEGNVPRMIQAWRRWGKEHGYI